MRRWWKRSTCDYHLGDCLWSSRDTLKNGLVDQAGLYFNLQLYWQCSLAKLRNWGLWEVYGDERQQLWNTIFCCGTVLSSRWRGPVLSRERKAMFDKKISPCKGWSKRGVLGSSQQERLGDFGGSILCYFSGLCANEQPQVGREGMNALVLFSSTRLVSRVSLVSSRPRLGGDCCEIHQNDHLSSALWDVDQSLHDPSLKHASYISILRFQYLVQEKSLALLTSAC